MCVHVCVCVCVFYGFAEVAQCPIRRNSENSLFLREEGSKWLEVMKSNILE